MKRALMLAAIAAGAAWAQSWTPLSDGKSLAGWVVEAKSEDRAKEFWKAANGAIVCDSRGRKDHDYVWLVNEREFGDFDLRLEVRADSTLSGNTGVQFRSRYDGAASWMNGPQVDIHPPTPWRAGLIYDETRETRRWIHPSLPDWKIEPAQGPKQWKWNASGWNRVELFCRGTKVRTVVNGVTISDFDGAGVLDDEAHRKRNVGLRGRIALQLHSSDEVLVEYRNIEVREPR